MKKILLLLVLGFGCHVCHAQLVVNRTGKVSIGTEEESRSILSVGSKGTNSATVYISPSNTYGLQIANDTLSNPITRRGLYVNLHNLTGMSYGIDCANTGQGTATIRGLKASASGGLKNIGVLGTSEYSGEPTAFSTGVFGSHSTGTCADFGEYAGYFLGNVKVVGMINGVVVAPSATSCSDALNLSSMIGDEEGMGVTDRLRGVQLLQTSRKNLDPVVYESNTFENNEMEETQVKGETPITEHAYSLAADQLKEVYPELVFEDEQGRPCINYTELVPLLVQSINELSAKIERLEGKTTSQPKRTTSKTSATGIYSEKSDQLSLSQNDPNPFTLSTSIAMSIPASVSKATLVIYDMTGKQLRQIEIAERGNTSVTLTSEGLTPGMYIYALIADGQVISTKRMILN